MINKIDKKVIKIFYYYVAFFYLTPFLYHLFYKELLQENFNGVGRYYPALVIVLVILATFFYNNLALSFKFSGLGRISGLIIGNLKLNYFLVVIYLASSIYFFLNYDMSFRHSQRLANAGGIVYIKFILANYFKAYLFYLVLLLYKGVKLKSGFRVISLLISVSYILGLNSSFDAIFIFLSLLIAFKGEAFLLERENKLQGFFKKNIKIIVFVILGLSVFFIGVVNKTGVKENSLELFFKSFELMFHGLLQRISTHYISVLAAYEYFYEMNFDSHHVFRTFYGIFHKTLYNFSVLTGGGMEPVPIDYSSFKRTNYQILNVEAYNKYTGASPGLFASVFYLPLFPLNILLVAAYIKMILTRMSQAFRESKFKITFVSGLIMVFFILPLFESPIDLLNVFDTDFLYFFFFLGVTYSINKT